MSINASCARHMHSAICERRSLEYRSCCGLWLRRWDLCTAEIQCQVLRPQKKASATMLCSCQRDSSGAMTISEHLSAVSLPPARVVKKKKRKGTVGLWTSRSQTIIRNINVRGLPHKTTVRRTCAVPGCTSLPKKPSTALLRI